MILDEIIADIRQRLAEEKRRIPLARIQELALEQPQPLDLARALSGNGVKLIAEVKKASPSKGIIRQDFDPVKIAGIYAENGAAVISVLTETQHFQGSLDYIKIIKQALGDRKIPILRKDFIIDEYQLYQSRACGADSLLLIAAVLQESELKEMLELSHALGMKCLVEVHNESEVKTAIDSGAQIIGINNRDLKTFNVGLSVTGRLRWLIPPGRLVVSESGIANRDDMQKLDGWRVNAALVGEALMATDDIATKMKELLWQE